MVDWAGKLKLAEKYFDEIWVYYDWPKPRLAEDHLAENLNWPTSRLAEITIGRKLKLA
jgi:hypothetical protein